MARSLRGGAGTRRRSAVIDSSAGGSATVRVRAGRARRMSGRTRRRSARARRRSRRGRARRAGGGARSLRRRAARERSSSSKRWLRACMKLVITTSSGERSMAGRRRSPTRSSTNTRSTGPESACHSGTLLTTPPSTRRRPSWCDDREHAGQRRAREQRRLQRAAREHDLFAGVEVGARSPGTGSRGRRTSGPASSGG